MVKTHEPRVPHDTGEVTETSQKSGLDMSSLEAILSYYRPQFHLSPYFRLASAVGEISKQKIGQKIYGHIYTYAFDFPNPT